MFNLNDFNNENKNKKDYFILIDEQETTFCAGIVFETLEEIVEQFRSYAESDEYEDPKLFGWTIRDLLNNWDFTLKFWRINNFVEVSEHDKDAKGRNILSYTIKNDNSMKYDNTKTREGGFTDLDLIEIVESGDILEWPNQDREKILKLYLKTKQTYDEKTN